MLQSKKFNLLFYMLLLVGLLMLAVTAFKGGEPVYRYGVLVKAGHGRAADVHAEMNPVTGPDKILPPIHPQQSQDDHSTHTH